MQKSYFQNIFLETAFAQSLGYFQTQTEQQKLEIL